jgi:C-terminal processing protease CtpA/Prc
MFKFVKKGLWLAVILSMSITLSACNKEKMEKPVNNEVATSETGKLTKEQWVEDINYLKENLEKKHKSLYHKITKEEFQKQCEDLKKELNKLTDFQVKLRMKEIVASIGDAHTSLSIGEGEKVAYYPIGVDWFGEELKIYAAEKEHKDIIGKTLVAIDGTPVNEIMNKINKLIPHENQQWLKVINVSYVNLEQVLKELKITKGNEAKFTVKDDKGIESNATLTAKEFQQNNLITVQDSYTEKPIAAQYDENDPNWQLYWYKYIPEDKIMYFQYNQCIDRDTAKTSGYENFEQLPRFRDITDKLIKELNEKDVDKFVIDLRYNSGGNSMLMDDFVSQLYDVKKLREEGKIFVMTGRQTFSSGVMACRSLKNSTKAMFFGEPTGGNMNGYGDIQMLTLPNSKLEASYSTKYFELDPSYKEGFVPDVVMEQSFDNYLKGIDDVYEAVRKYGKE